MKHGTVFVAGNFNVLHPGHLRLLKFAKENGTRLIVGVFSDRLAGNGAHVPQALRLEAVKMNSLVDEAVLIDSAVEDVIRQIKPAMVVKGREHRLRENPEQKAVESYGGKLIFSSGDVIFSSLDLIRREVASLSHRTILAPREFMARRKVSAESLIELMSKFKDLKVVIVGDVIVDEYIACEPLGMSEEDPTIVVTPISNKMFIGGAAIVAAHAASLGASAQFFSVVGDDHGAEFSREELTKFGVKHHLFVDDSRPTTLKQRFRNQSKTLFRVSHLVQRSIEEPLQRDLVENVVKACGDADLLIFSDFNYGVLPQSVVDQITSEVAKGGIKIVADSQSSSQIGDISRFRNTDLITPTEREARLALRNPEDGLVIVAELVCQKANARNAMITLGEQGVLLHARNDKTFETDQIPALNLAPQDVAGAGDCLLVVSSLALTAGANMWQAGLLGSFAAAIQVGRVGNTPITLAEIQHELSE